jgi:hypothetical protein
MGWWNGALGYCSNANVGEFRFTLSANDSDWIPVPGANVQATRRQLRQITT